MQERSHIREGGEFLVIYLDALHVTLALCRFEQLEYSIIEHVTNIGSKNFLDDVSSGFTSEIRSSIPKLVTRLEEKV